MGKIIKKPKDFNQEEGLSLWYFDKNNPIKKSFYQKIKVLSILQKQD